MLFSARLMNSFLINRLNHFCFGKHARAFCHQRRAEPAVLCQLRRAIRAWRGSMSVSCWRRINARISSGPYRRADARGPARGNRKRWRRRRWGVFAGVMSGTDSGALGTAAATEALHPLDGNATHKGLASIFWRVTMCVTAYRYQ